MLLYLLHMKRMSVFGGNSQRGAVASVLDSDIVVSVLKLRSYNYVHLRTNTFWERYMTPLTPLQLWIKLN